MDLYLIHFPVGFLPGKDDSDLFPRDEEGKAKIDMATDIIALWKVKDITSLVVTNVIHPMF